MNIHEGVMRFAAANASGCKVLSQCTSYRPDVLAGKTAKLVSPLAIFRTGKASGAIGPCDNIELLTLMPGIADHQCISLKKAFLVQMVCRKIGLPANCHGSSQARQMPKCASW